MDMLWTCVRHLISNCVIFFFPNIWVLDTLPTLSDSLRTRAWHLGRIIKVSCDSVSVFKVLGECPTPIYWENSGYFEIKSQTHAKGVCVRHQYITSGKVLVLLRVYIYVYLALYICKYIIEVSPQRVVSPIFGKFVCQCRVPCPCWCYTGKNVYIIVLAFV